MKITVFTSNQERHIGLIRELAKVADEVVAIQECRTVFPERKESFLNHSAVMKEYFKRMIDAERFFFGESRFLPSNVYQVPIERGDLNLFRMDELGKALESDLYVIFGSSFIKSDLIDFLVERHAINIHMGVSPYYRGSACNFWAAYEGKPEYIGASIIYLSKGLDKGDILYHALPSAKEEDTVMLGMHAVKSAIMSLVEVIYTNKTMDKILSKYQGVGQNKSLEIRYSRESDFNETVAKEYLEHLMDTKDVKKCLDERKENLFIRPIVI